MTADDGYFAFVCGMWEVNKPMLPEETAAHVRKDTADYGKIQLTCRCGFGFLSLRQRYHECPKCGELYDLKPDEPGMSQFCRSG